MKTQNFKPILFSTEMVQAILAGKKTQTRRIIKIKTTPFIDNFSEESMKKHLESPGAREIYGGYNAGDILWVRETFQKLESVNHKEIDFLYKADVEYYNYFNSDLVVWSPSIHMPKEAARIFLKVTNVRVERLQDISEEDAIAEGVDNWTFKNMAVPQNFRDYSDTTSPPLCSAYDSFETLWQSINAKKNPWESNPWVWVYEFERIEKPENFLS